MRKSKCLKIIISVVLILGLVLPINTVAFAGSERPLDPGAREACTTFFIGKDLTENGAYL